MNAGPIAHHPTPPQLVDPPLRSPDPVASRSATGTLLFSLSIFASAFLLFSVQPLIAKYILPWFGGGAGVWTTCMLFFQALLLLGYIYAHLITRYLRPLAQVATHLLLLLIAILLLPIIPVEHSKPLTPDSPTRQILALLVTTLGLPYFVLSATTPLLQAWFTRLLPTRSPYPLYAVSNAASLLALLSYPFLLEPLTTRTTQAYLWSAAFIVFAALFITCALHILHSAPRPSTLSSAPPSDHHPRLIHLLLWTLLPACAAASLLGATTKICQDIAVVPFLWILTLALYLLSFILTFQTLRWYARSAWLLILLLAQALFLWTIFQDIQSITLRIALHSLFLFACCMLCHGELASLKPTPAHLTSFYLCIALGGMLGSAAVALLAPLLFDGFYEIYLAAILTVALVLTLILFDPQHRLPNTTRLPLYATIPNLILLVLLLYAETVNTPPNATLIKRHRSFFGVLTVCDRDPDIPHRHLRMLRHGVITHGSQFLHPSLRQRPVSYYGPHSGIALLLQNIPPHQPRRIGVIGLGTGTLAAYGRPGDFIRFYEIDPHVTHLARTAFSFLADSPATIEIHPGDARLSLEAQPPQNYDILVIDAFTSDAIPAHLLTRQAFDIYLRHLAPDGTLAIHISNRHLDLQPVLAQHADHAALHAALIHSSTITYPDAEFSSDWALLTRNPALLQSPAIQAAAQPLRRNDRLPPWTDDYTPLFPLLK